MVLYMPSVSLNCVVGFWYLTMENLVARKRLKIAENAKKFKGNDDHSKITDAKVNTAAPIRTETLFQRPAGMDELSGITPLVLSVFAVSLDPALFVERVYVVDESTLEYKNKTYWSPNGADRTYRINTTVMDQRLLVRYCFNPEK